MNRFYRHSFSLIAIYFVTAISLLISCSASKSGIVYPNAKQVAVSDTYHGVEVSDPYRWLENSDSVSVKEWVAAQQNITDTYLKTSASYETINARLQQLWNYPKLTAPLMAGNRMFFYKNAGLENHPVLYTKQLDSKEVTVLLDPNKWSKDGNEALSKIALSRDGQYVSFAVTEKGGNEQRLSIKNVLTGEVLPDSLGQCRNTRMSWHPDNSGFYYSRFPDSDSLSGTERWAYSAVYYHKLGTDQSQDRLIYENREKAGFIFTPRVSYDGTYLLIYGKKGSWGSNHVLARPLGAEDEGFKQIMPEGYSYYVDVYNDGPVFYFQTNANAPRGKILSIDIENPESSNTRDVIAESDRVITYADLVGKRLIVCYIEDAHHQLEAYNLQGEFLQDINLPMPGSVVSFFGSPEDDALLISFTSFIYPPTILKYEFGCGKMSLMESPDLAYNLQEYETTQVFYTSKDGEKIPMFLTHKKGLKLNGKNPVLLYGYGGFRVSLTPHYAPHRMLWLERGGVFAIANIRGGNEYGEAWHQAGIMEKKQNVFDDFIGAAEWLIANKYTSPSKLAIRGRSNGGLLTTACLTQRPDLFGAVVSEVPLTDMLRFHKFSVGRYWLQEYGNAEENAEHFEFLRKYSPLHNLKQEVAYPATFVTTAENDDRVAPLHAKKFVAALQNLSAGEAPILLRMEAKSGHGAGKPLDKQIAEQTDVYTFLYKVLQIETKPIKTVAQNTIDTAGK